MTSYAGKKALVTGGITGVGSASRSASMSARLAALYLAFEATFTTGLELKVDGGITSVTVSQH